MKKNLLYFLLVLCLVMNQNKASAQERTVSGKITLESDGSPIPGVSVILKGTASGTITDAEGNYKISIPNEVSILIYSFIGLKTVEANVGAKAVVNIQMNEDATELTEVVVTALGIERERSSLGYSTQQVTSDNLRVARETNVNTAIAGKIAGVQVISGSGAKFGTSKIRIRGVRGLTPSDPLYVLDGIIISDAATINMDNIESINVLKGPGASALYGSRARDGVVILTSKRSEGESLDISVNHTTTFERVYVLPEYQNEYGGGYSQNFLTFNYNPSLHDPALQTINGAPMPEFYADESWGPKMEGQLVAQWDAFTKGTDGFATLRPWVPHPDNVRDFFRTGVFNNTSISVGKSSENYYLNTTLTRSDRTGVMENTSQDKLFFNVNAGVNLRKNLNLQISSNYHKENTSGNLFEGYNSIGSNINQWFQRQLDVKLLKKYYQLPDGTYTSWNINSPADISPLYWDNPYTTVYAINNKYEKEVLSGKFALNYEIIPGLVASTQITRSTSRGDVISSTASGTLNLDGFSTTSGQDVEDNFQTMLSYKKVMENFSAQATIGSNYRRNEIKYMAMGTGGGLSSKNLFNISASNDPANVTNYIGKDRVNSIFAQANFGFREFIFLDGSFRRDYDSRLPDDKNSFDYPSASLSFVFSELLNFRPLSFGKLRGSYATVGSEINRYQTIPTYALITPSYEGNSRTSVPNSLVDPDLRAATTNSFEVGVELSFIDNRIKTDFAFYTMNNDNELLNVTIPSSSGGNGLLTNSVESTTKGWELAIGGTPIRGGLNWDVNFNIAKSTSTIDALGYDLGAIALQNGFRGTESFGGFGAISAKAEKGKEWGVIVGRKFRRDTNGNIVVDADGAPLYDANQDLGNILPDFTGGIFNRLRFKGIELAFTIDYQVGGTLYSITRMFNAYSGLGAETVGNNDKGIPVRDDPADGGGLTFGGVFEDGTPNNIYLPADEYWKSLFALHEKWIYDATFVKMREIRLGYTIPSSITDPLLIKNLSIAFVANNLFLIYSKVPGIDPSEIGGDTIDARNNGAWSEGGNLPGTRTFGFDIKFNF